MSISDIKLLLSGEVHTSKLTGISQERLLSIREDMCQKYQGKTLQEWADIHNVSITHMQRQYRLYGKVDILFSTATGGSRKRYRGLLYSQWAEKLGVTWVTINKHINTYGNLKLVGTTHRSSQRRYHCPKGVFDNIKQVSKAMGVSEHTCYNRIHKKTVMDYPDWYEVKNA